MIIIVRHALRNRTTIFTFVCRPTYFFTFWVAETTFSEVYDDDDADDTASNLGTQKKDYRLLAG